MTKEVFAKKIHPSKTIMTADASKWSFLELLKNIFLLSTVGTVWIVYLNIKSYILKKPIALEEVKTKT